MSPNVAPFSALHACIESIWERLFPLFSVSSMSDDPQEDTRNRREFMHEILNRNPDAFKSELDVQSMMQMYPNQF